MSTRSNPRIAELERQVKEIETANAKEQAELEQLKKRIEKDEREAEHYVGDVRRAEGVLLRYTMSDAKRREQIEAGATAFGTDVSNFANVPPGPLRLFALPKYLGLPDGGPIKTTVWKETVRHTKDCTYYGEKEVEGPTLRPTPLFSFERSLLPDTSFAYCYSRQAPSLPAWLGRQADIERYLGFEVVIRQADEFHIVITKRAKLADVIAFERKYLKADHYFVGFDAETGAACHVPFDQSLHWVVAGQTGMGKSSLIHGMLASALFSGHRIGQIYLYDGKNGEEFAVLADLPRVKLVNTTAALHGLAAELVALMAQRQAENAKARRRLYDGPLTLVVIDECQTLFDVAFDKSEADKKASHAKFVANMADVVRRGRSAGLRVVFLTQKPTSDALPSEIFNNCGTKVVFRLGLAATQSGMFPGRNDLPDLMSLPAFRAVLLNGQNSTLTNVQVTLPPPPGELDLIVGRERSQQPGGDA